MSSTSAAPHHSASAAQHTPATPGSLSTASASSDARKKLTLVPLIFLIYFDTAGGPYGAEPAVLAVGPLLALLGFLIFPLVSSIPESLVTAELSGAIPGNGAFVLWADRAFGPFAGSMIGYWKYLAAVINSAAIPALCVDYLARVLPAVSSTAGRRTISIIAANAALSLLNLVGLSAVGWVTVVLGLASLSPFAVIAVASATKLKPRRWAGGGPARKDWRLFLNTLFWNLHFSDGGSSIAGEVDRPWRTYPRALIAAVTITTLSYLITLMAVAGALNAPSEAWRNGYFATAAAAIAGRWLSYWVEAGAVLSNVGLYEAELTGSAFQLLGMAELGLLPRAFARRRAHGGTPWVGILFSAAVSLAVSFLGFEDIVASANLLDSLGMLLQYAAFFALRVKEPQLERPFRAPGGALASAALCAVPSALLIFMVIIAGWKVTAVGAGFTALGSAAHVAVKVCKARGYGEFIVPGGRG